MSRTITLSPAGHLIYESATDETGTAQRPFITVADDGLGQAFAESTAAGLIALARLRSPADLDPALIFWRGFARQLFTALCSLGEASPRQWASLAEPPDAALDELVSTAPPMRGLEYLNPAVLRNIWREMATTVSADASKYKAGPTAYLHDIDPAFHQLGRVTLHLAENKRDANRPFAFLATFTHRVSEQAKVAHLPLAEALKSYASARDAAKLKSLLSPVERAAEQSVLIRDLLDRKALFAPQAWSIRQAYQFLQEIPKIEAAGIVVRVPDWWYARKPPRPQVQVRLGDREPSGLGLDGMLDFQAELTLDGEILTDAERKQLMAAAEGMTLLRGKWVEVDQERLQQALAHWKQVEKAAADGVDFMSGMRLLAGAALDPTDREPESVADWSNVVAGDWLRDALSQMRSPEPDRACQPGCDLQATLRPYQVEGVRWLWFMTQLGLGACLADDMGLGKTVQVIDLLLQRRRAAKGREIPPSLLVVPASLLGNWQQELTRFAPTLKSRILHRSECDTETLARIGANPQVELAGVDLVITTYGFVRRQSWLATVRWSLVILDEAQAIKNAGSSQTKCVKALLATARLVLTGTPVENHLGDLWSIFDFALPGLLGSAADFKKYIKRLNQQVDARSYGSLRRLVRPYILRRLKTDPTIVPDLPEKTELWTECGLSKKQAVLYEKAVTDLAKRLKEADGMARRGLVLGTLVQLKQICNHPAQYLHSDNYPPADSSKFERLRLLCEPIVERQERMLVFTQFQSLTAPLADYLATIFGQAGLVLHGGTPVKRRSELVKAFQAEEGPPFFVISLKAGGSGLNLTAASHVVHFDRWWNPAVENQATDRAFRIGQRRNVLVHKFVCRGTVEERIHQLITSKQAIADQVLGPDQEAETKLTELSDAELMKFVALDVRRALEDD